MTRPLGKSPARSRVKSSQLDLNQMSLIDVRAEDDELLPENEIASPQGGSGPNQCPRPGVSPFKVNATRTLACIQEDRPVCEGLQGIDEDESQDVLPPLPTEELVVKKKKKKSGFNLRKSLAWNNAFFTEEGVLDTEELSLVNRTFKKPLEQPKPPSNKKSPLASKFLNSTALSKINFSPVRFQKSSSQGETRHHSTAPTQSSPSSSLGNALRRTDQQNRGVKGSAVNKHISGPASFKSRDDTIKHGKPMLPTRGETQGLKPAPLRKQIEENPRIISGPGLPARKPPLNQLKQTQSISSTLSSASRMMKDRLGMVFAGRNVDNPKLRTKTPAEDDTVVPSHTTPEYSGSAKLARCYSHSTYERFGKSTASPATELAGSAPTSASTAPESTASHLQGLCANKVTPSSFTSFSSSLCKGREQASGALFSHFQKSPQPSALEATNSNTRETGASETLLLNFRPSGLRMPSPKLGFFDKAKTSNAAHVAVLRERTNGLGHDGVASQSARYAGTAQLSSDVTKQSCQAKTSNAAHVAVLRERTNGLGHDGVASHSAKYAGTAQLLSDVTKQSSSNSYGVFPQTLKVASGQITVSTDINGPGSLNSMQKPPIPSKTSGKPRSEHGNGAEGLPRIATTTSLQFTENSFKPEPSSTLPCVTGSVPCSSSYASSSLSSCSLPTPCELTSLSSHISGSHNSDTETILQEKAQNVLPAVKKMANKLDLSPLRITQQENLPSEHSQIKRHLSPGNERACSMENIRGLSTTELQEEWPQVKSGAVQHSPPHKEPPKYGPWSPVRRNAPELGPFDCTKYMNSTASLQ
ncbi:hypothetical protein L7F22_005848 [Adiantum nelumboides]|nr:hypothetical protein [Adiantum nelumboides]